MGAVPMMTAQLGAIPGTITTTFGTAIKRLRFTALSSLLSLRQLHRLNRNDP